MPPAPPEVLTRVTSTVLLSTGGLEFLTCELQDTSDGAELDSTRLEKKLDYTINTVSIK